MVLIDLPDLRRGTRQFRPMKGISRQWVDICFETGPQVDYVKWSARCNAFEHLRFIGIELSTKTRRQHRDSLRSNFSQQVKILREPRYPVYGTRHRATGIEANPKLFKNPKK
jgi:hypothetical protein